MEDFNMQETKEEIWQLEDPEQAEKKPSKRSGIGKFFFGLLVGAALSLTVMLLCMPKDPKTDPEAKAQETPSTLVSRDEDVLNKLALIESYLRLYGLDPLDDDQIEEYLYRGLVAGTGDYYAAYYTPEEYTSKVDSIEGSFCGIGAAFSQNLTTGEIRVVTVYKDTPAERGGLKEGDILYAVDGEDVREYDLSEITSNRIKGEKGTEVVLTVLREDAQVEVSMIRDIVEISTISSEMLEDHIGYIQITEFDAVTGTQFVEALEELKSQGMTSLIMDLRDNGGGRVTAAIEVADALLPEGMIFYTEYSDGTIEEEYSDAECLGLPIVVLMNEYSASASEIVAGALKDHGVATLVGTKSYGKGIVQSVIQLKDGSGLCLTTSRYYTPNGNNIHGVGIEPDVYVELPDEVLNQGLTKENDVQLQKAKEVLQQ